MLRLILALVVCYVLFPTVEDSKTVDATEGFNLVVNTPTISTFDTLSAVNSVIHDVGSFCERNEEACITGSILISNAHQVAKSTIDELLDENEGQLVQVSRDNISE